MKRIFVSLAGIVGLIAVVYMGWDLARGFQNGGDGLSGLTATRAPQVADLPADNGIEQEVVENVAPMPTEVGLDAASSYMGRGGGGGYGFGGESPFANATMTLNTTLPALTEAQSSSYPTPYQGAIDVEEVRNFARNMGVNGDLFYEWYGDMPVDGPPTGPDSYVSYRVFDGNKRVTAYSGSELTYEVTVPQDVFNVAPLPFEQRAAIAEQFARDHGLLTGEYELHAGWGHEVQFLTVVDGSPVTNWSLVSMTVAPTGEVTYLAYRELGSAIATETVGLRSAQEAWEYLQSQVKEGQLFINIIAQDPNYYAPQGMPNEGKYHWELEYVPGQEMTIQSWVQIFRPADGSRTPMIMTDRGLVLSADAAILEAIAEASTSGQNVRLTGVVGGDENQKVFEVSAWESLTGPVDLYLTGTLREDAGHRYLELPGGFMVEINNAPADLPTDVGASVYSWGIRTADNACGAILDWITIDLMFTQMEDQARPVADPYMNITDVNINEVELAYQFMHPGEFVVDTMVPFRSDGNAHLMPVWWFKGTTNNGDIVEISIPASADIEFIEAEN